MLFSAAFSRGLAAAAGDVSAGEVVRKYAITAIKQVRKQQHTCTH
jgi:hypothetical protein